MKKAFIILVLLGLLAWRLPAVDLDLGLFFGARTVNDGKIQDVYGGGTVFFPQASVSLYKGLFAGLGYEFGYDRDGAIGLYGEEANLKVAGPELFAGYRFDLGKVSPYLKLGLASYAYKQTVSGETRVDDSKTSLTLAGGARFFPAKSLFLAAEVKYVPLKVKPVDVEVDLGGWRIAAGIGYMFSL